MRRKVGRIGTTIGRQTRARRARGLPKPDNGSGRPFRVAPEPPPEGAARRAVVRPALALVKGVGWCWGGQAGRAGVSPPRRQAWGLLLCAVGYPQVVSFVFLEIFSLVIKNLFVNVFSFPEILAGRAFQGRYPDIFVVRMAVFRGSLTFSWSKVAVFRVSLTFSWFVLKK